MVAEAQIVANWRNTHTHVDHAHSVTHLHQHSYNHVWLHTNEDTLQTSFDHGT